MAWQKGQPWRVVKSLNVLNDQIRAYAPRSVPPATPVYSWGSIADDAHNASSDHYPHYYSALGSTAVVTARDFPHAPSLGLDGGTVCELLRQSRDPRIKYVIYNRRIFSGYRVGDTPAYTWRGYDGSDPHDTHFHISSVNTAIADSVQPWAIPSTAGGDEDMDAGQNQRLVNTDELLYAIGQMKTNTPASSVNTPTDVAGVDQIPFVKVIYDLQNKLTALSTGGVTQDMVNQAMVFALQQPAVLNALKPVLEEAAFKGSQKAEDE